MVDYSKWKDIEVSDDEDDTHPNIDTPSLFRWRHDARLQRMEEAEGERKALEKKKSELEKKKKEAEREKAKTDVDVSPILEKLSVEEKKILEEEQELKKKERLTPWNVDTIGKPGFSKTVINVAKPKNKEVLTDEEKATRFHDFTVKYEKELKKFGMLRKYEDSKKFLAEHPDLACEDTANYLTFWCIDLAIEEKNNLLDHVSHQAIAVQFMLELAKQTDMDPRACASSFFSKMGHVDQTEYKEAFDTELRLFQQRIRKRAEQKIQQAKEEDRKEREAEREARLGPGGLDPFEVIETLPEELKQCFETQDIPMLHKVIGAMKKEEAEYHMKRCVASGLWVANAKDKASDAEGTEETEPDAPKEPVESDNQS